MAEKERTPNRRIPKRIKRRRTPWRNSELAVFGIAALIFLFMTVSGLGFLMGIYQEVQQDRKDAASNHQEYVTFFRDVVSHMTMDEKDNDKENDKEETDTEPQTEVTASGLDVDLTQFEEDEGFAGQLYRRRDQYNGEVEAILSYYEDAVCTVDGAETTVGKVKGEDAIPQRMIQLAVDNPETIRFVADYPAKHAASTKPVERTSNSEVPLYIQWDEAWGYSTYGGGAIAYNGCAPTAMAMAATYLTGQTVTPLEASAFADEQGYYIPGTGTDWKFITEGADHYGLKAESMDFFDEEKLSSALESGALVICTMSPGDFTQTGHFLLLTGYENGEFTLNDPNSILRSGETWSFDRLNGQFRHLWTIVAD